MPSKFICILADSAKNEAHCIAGREVEQTASGGWKLKNGWVRPISHRPKGELFGAEAKLVSTGKVPKLLDIVEIPLEGKGEVEGQPEDWLIEKKNPWKYCGQLSQNALVKMLEEPDDLWLQPKTKSDRITPAYLRTHPKPSLYLINPESFEVHVEKRTWEEKTTSHRRVQFTYRGHRYDWGLTDLSFTKQYCEKPWTMDEGLVPGAPTSVNALCVSLSPPISFGPGLPEFHYKLAAGVFV